MSKGMRRKRSREENDQAPQVQARHHAAGTAQTTAANGVKGVAMKASRKSAKQPGVDMKDVRLDAPPAQTTIASGVLAMPNADSAEDRITMLCKVVPRAVLRDWIGGPDKLFEVLPEPSDVQALLQGTDKELVMRGLNSLLTFYSAALDAERRQSLALGQRETPPTTSGARTQSKPS